MRLFISHCDVDVEAAEQIRLVLNEIPGVSCYLQALDIHPGVEWGKGIREGARDCDEILLLMTPEYLERPWFYAEWAIFWFQEKPWTLLLLDAKLEDSFEPMRKMHVAHLDTRRSVESLLERLYNCRSPARGLALIANDLITAVADARRRAALLLAEKYLDLLSACFRNMEDVNPELVKRLLEADRLSEILAIAKKPENRSDVKRRQFAVILVNQGLSQSASEIEPLLINNAERKNIGVACLERIKAYGERGIGADNPMDLLFTVYRRVRDPQRRNLQQEAVRLELSIDWPEVEPNP